MNNEADFKKAFCNCAAKQGGYTFKIAMSTMSGLPDLYCIVPGYIPVLLEAKWMREVPENGKFKRKIPYRPLQQDYLTNCNRVIRGSAWGLIGLDCGENKYVCLMDPQVPIITHDKLINPIDSMPIVGDMVDVIGLFEGVVPKLHLTCNK